MYEPRKLTPAKGKWLCNRAQRVTSQMVYLGINADPEDWQEITEAEKNRLEQEWAQDAELPDNDALAILTGGADNA